MAHRFIVFIIIASTFSSGCNKPQCSQTVTCIEGLEPAAVNYSFADLDTVIVNIYTANDSFNDLVNSIRIPDTDSTSSNTLWHYPYYYGAIDTLQGNASLNTNCDIEIIVPSNNNKTYRYTKITYGGLSEIFSCNLDPLNPKPFCNAYLVSYVLNGTKVNFSANINSGYLYFSK